MADEVSSPEAEALLQRIVATPRNPQTAPKRKLVMPIAPRRVLIAGASLAAAGVVALQFLGSSDSQTPSKSLLAVLNRTAGTAEAQADTYTGGIYHYLKYKSLSLAIVADSAAAGGPFSVLVPKVEEQWVRKDRHGGRLRSTPDGQLVFPGPRDRVRWVLAGRPALSNPDDETLPESESFSGDDLSDLPTDTDQLFERVKQRAQEASDVPLNVEMFTVVGDWLLDPSASPEVRAALYRVAGNIAGVELVGPKTDLAGRSGTAIGITSDHSGTKARQELIFDPATSRVLGRDEVQLETVKYVDAQPPFTDDAQAFLATGATNTTTETP